VLINYPNKQQNFSEFIAFSSPDSGSGCPSPTLRKQKTQGQPNKDVFMLLEWLKQKKLRLETPFVLISICAF